MNNQQYNKDADNDERKNKQRKRRKTRSYIDHEERKSKDAIERESRNMKNRSSFVLTIVNRTVYIQQENKRNSM